jgi:hypothetical protein
MGEPIYLLLREVSMDGPMEAPALIRKEKKAIGINITSRLIDLHLSWGRAEKMFCVKYTAKLYSEIESKIDRLLKLMEKLAK